MDVTWQWNNEGMNPADAAIGPQIYDNHLYYKYVSLSLFCWVRSNEVLHLAGVYVQALVLKQCFSG